MGPSQPESQTDDPGFRLDAYDYQLPEELIAQVPAATRAASRLLVLDRQTGEVNDRWFSDLPALLEPGDLLVINDTRVFPARLRGRRLPGGGHAELLLVRELESEIWEALARPGRRLGPGARMAFGDGRLRGEVVAVAEDGRRVVRFESDEAFWDVIEAVGEPPLPHYIRRPQGAHPDDRERYQTVYARERGAVAAPTAGLHFTEQILGAMRARGIDVAALTLHVGYGTFEPVRADDLREHRVAAERFVVPEDTARAARDARRRGGRIVAVGTTTTRALESAAADDGSLIAGAGEAVLTVTPGFRFRVVDAMVTNFHLPRSSLLVMVATFGGRETVLGAYRHAVRERYRFYSYGDAMLIA